MIDIKKIGSIVFLGIIIFFVIPIEIIRNNYVEFGDPIRPLFYASVLLAIFIAGNTIILSFLKSKKLSDIYIIALFYFGIFILISDLISPLLIGILEKGNETPVEATQGIILDFVLLISLLLLSIKTSARFIIKVSWILCSGLIFVQIVLVSTLILRFEYKPEMGSGFSDNETLFEGNIYQITFDEYSSIFFPLAVNALGLKKEFEGFDYYTNARSNYLATLASVPSFMTGRLFTGGGHLKDWLDRTPQNSIVAKLKTLGFKTTFYSPYNHSWHFPADKVVKTPASMSGLADLSLLRLVPTILRQEVYSEGKGLISRSLSKISQAPQGDSYRAFRQFEHMLETETYRSKQKEYIYAHYFLPHPPNVLTRTGAYAPNQSSFQEEILLATNMMVRFIRKLKELDRFDSSLIILQADHGTGWATTLDQTNIERTKPLLLVKTPKARNHDVRPVEDLVQLVDIYQAILDQISPEKETTKSLSQSGFLTSNETINIYHVYALRKKPGGKTFRIGKDYFVGEMNWISIDSDGERTDHPPIEVQW